MTEPLIIIPSFISRKEHAQVLLKCIETLNKSADSPEILIVDDCSPYQEQARILYDHFQLKYDNIELEYNDTNRGFSFSVNKGLKQCLEEKRDGVLVNADIEFREIGWLDEMKKTDASIIGALLFYENSLVQHAGTYFSKFTRSFDHRFKGCPPDYDPIHKQIECPCTAALLYIRNECLEEVGLFDEDFLLGWEDVDYNLRSIKEGHKAVYNPKVKAIHHESLFRGKHSASEKTLEMQKKSFLYLLEKYKGADFSGLVRSNL